MWCPEGYTTFCEIDRALRQLVKSDDAYERIYETAHQLHPSIAIWSRFDMAGQRILCECIDEFFLNCKSLSVFSSSGICFKIDARVAVHRDIPSLGWQFPFIDKLTGTVSLSHFRNCFDLATASLQSMRDNLDEIDKDEYAYLSYCELSKIEDDFEYLDTFENFNGWAVGCLISDAVFAADDFRSLDVFYQLVEKSEQPDRSHNLKDSIIKAFDLGEIRGKNRLWKDYFRSESREAFRAAWAEAACDRPELSKRGPKQLK